ncbi:MAG: hypothetical protein JXX14_21730 [Deltaproteobacteria bacterium]|nr:hypothetical protein [Deltaproteobacteria bacterium]
MLQFCLTPKVRSLFAYADDMLSLPEAGDAFLGNWYVDIVHIMPYDSLLLMSEKTLLSFVLLNIRQDHSEMLANGFFNGLEHLLQEEKFAERSIQLLMQGLELMNITAAVDKRRIASLTNIGLLYSEEVKQSGGLDNCNILDVMKRINRFPHPSLNHQSPIKATKTLLRNSDTRLH